MIIPLWAYGAGGAVLLAVGAAGGWMVNDWRHDSKALDAMKAATKAVDDQRKAVDAAASKYETEKQDGIVRQEVRTNELRTIYRDRPVRSDCAAPDSVHGVLAGAVADANARAAGQPAPAVPGAPDPTRPTD